MGKAEIGTLRLPKRCVSKLGVTGEYAEDGGRVCMFAFIDEEDRERLSGYKWYVGIHGNNYYVKATTYTDRRKDVIMHRLIMNAPSGKRIKIVNGNGLDCRKCNLKVAASDPNVTRRRKRKSESSRFRGVTPAKGIKKWHSTIYNKYTKKTIDLDHHDTEEEAAIAYNSKAIELYGEFARLNDVDLSKL